MSNSQNAAQGTRGVVNANIARKGLKLPILTGKLVPVMVIILAVTVVSLFLTYTALSIQSTARAFVNGEALWSKAQRDAVFYLDQYAETREGRYYLKFQTALQIIMGDRRARLELQKLNYDYRVVLKGFQAGGNHPADIPGVVRLFRCCAHVGYLARAIALWQRADLHMLELARLGKQLHAEIDSVSSSPARINRIRQRAQRLGEATRPLTTAFSQTLGEAARWLNSVLLWAITGIVAGLILLGMSASGRILNRVWQSEAKYRALLDSANDALVVVDPRSGAVLESNKHAEQMIGLSAPKIVGTMYLDLYVPAQQPVAQLTGAADAEQARNVARLDVRHRDGHLIPAEVSMSGTVWEGKRVNLAIIRDITERLRAEEDLRIAANALANIAEGVMITDSQKHILSVNKAFTTISGYPPDEVIGKHLAHLQSDRHHLSFYRELWEAVEETGHWQGEIWNRRHNGEVYPAMLSVSAVQDERGKITNYVGVFTDISRYKDYEERLQHLAHHDGLTQLPNRIFFEDKMREAIRRARDGNHVVGLLFVDLDDFKNVNDRYGHTVGDELLASVARRIEGCVRQGDVVARVGGDEFAVLLDQLGEIRDAILVTQKLMDVLSAPLMCAGHELSIFASIGISCHPRDGDDVHTLLSNADAAMYVAKQESRNAYKLFSPSIKARASAKLELGNALRQAYQRREFTLVYQPCVELATGRITSAEALIRWRHPKLGDITPSTFIPIAEDIGMIRPITEWVLETACR